MIAACLGGLGWHAPGFAKAASTVEAREPELPDGTLAIVGRNRPITLEEVARASRVAVDSLTPETARRFLDLVIDRELLAEQAATETWVWTTAESAAIGALRDRLVMGAALDSMLEESRSRRRATGQPVPDALELGVLVRDSLVASLGITCEEGLLARLAKAWAALPRPDSDSSAAAQVRALQRNPLVAAEDSNAVIARSQVGDVEVTEILDAWRRLSPAYRMRIESPSQIRDLVANALFERVLRARARDAGHERSPAIVSALARARDEIAISHLLARDVFGAIRPDRARIERHYRDHRERWMQPLAVRVLQLSAASRREADRLAARLSDVAEAETLRALARRAGLPYESDWTARHGSAFERALAAGPGAVLGPEMVNGEFQVTRVLEVLPGRMPPLAEIRARVEADWSAEEAERRTRALCDQARRRIGVRLNEKMIAQLGLPRSTPLAGDR